MLFKKKNEVSIDPSNPLEVERAKLRGFSDLVKYSSALFTVSVVLSFAAAIASFLLLLTTFSESALLAVFGAVFTVIYLAAGLVLNDYTKRESDFLCKVKRRPLGYLLRANISKRLLITTAVTAAIFIVGAVIAFVLFATKTASWTLIVCAAALILATVFAALAFAVSELSRRYIIKEIDFFDELETSFAKRSHII